MKFKLDENLPASAAATLASAGHDVDIVVAEPVVALRDIGEFEPDFMKFFVGPFGEVCPVQGVTDPELVKVAVHPAQRFLEDQVELV